MLRQFRHLVALWIVVLAAETRRQQPSWQQYVRAPSSTMVRPARVLSTAGNVTNPNAVLMAGGDAATLSRPRSSIPVPPSWPNGTTATASSYHAPNTNNGEGRTYSPNNAIDGNVMTFWNDDTISAYPDILTITAPTSLNLSGITVESNRDGVPVDFTVETLGAAGWSLAGTVVGNSAIRIRVPFGNIITTNAIRISVTRDQNTAPGEFTRIAEVWPGLVPDEPQPPTIVVDFGIDVVGFPIISFAGASSNHPGVRVAFSETQQYLTDRSDFTRSDNGDTITPGTDQFAVPPEPIVWVDTHGCLFNGTAVCADGLHGFRYLKIYLDALATDAPYTEAYGEVRIDSIALNFTAFLGTPDTFAGWFECSDDDLNQFWYDASYTNEMNVDYFLTDYTEPRRAATPTLTGKMVIFDGPKRDRDPYVGDLAVSARTLYLTHDVSIASRNVLADLAEHQRADGWIPPASIVNYTLPLLDYPLWWVTCSYDYVVYTGDINYAQTYYPVLVKVLNQFYPYITDPATGLVTKGLNRTSGYGDYAFLPRTGPVAYYNALYVTALNNAAQIARFLGGHDADATTWEQRATTVSDAINTNLWDSSVGAYLDSTVGPVRHGQDGNGIAILSGVANRTRATAALKYWAQNVARPYGNAFFDNDALGAGFSQRVYAFISYFEIQARFITGMANSAFEEIRRLYGWMATHDPTITFWEGIGANGSMYEEGFTSAAHGWSTGVLPALTNFVLGVTPTGPGFKTWTVKPIPGSVTWAKGQVPTPRGPITVDWTRQGSSSSYFQLTVSVPAGTSGEISIPAASSSAWGFVEFRPVGSARSELSYGSRYADGYVTVQVSGGNYTLRAS